MIRIFVVSFIFFGWSAGISQGLSGKVTCSESTDYVLTHLLVPVGPVPTAFDPNGV
jgi:hypothetical protein